MFLPTLYAWCVRYLWQRNIFIFVPFFFTYNHMHHILYHLENTRCFRKLSDDLVPDPGYIKAAEATTRKECLKQHKRALARVLPVGLVYGNTSPGDARRIWKTVSREREREARGWCQHIRGDACTCTWLEHVRPLASVRVYEYSFRVCVVCARFFYCYFGMYRKKNASHADDAWGF